MILVFAVFNFTGCNSILKKIVTKSVSYSFADSDFGYGNTAKITFQQYNKMGVRLVDFEGTKLPTPDMFTVWEPAIVFPAGRPFDLRVFVYWNKDRFGERRRGIFKCPALAGNRSYELLFRGSYKNGGILTLRSGREIVCEQEIPPLPRRYRE